MTVATRPKKRGNDGVIICCPVVQRTQRRLAGVSLLPTLVLASPKLTSRFCLCEPPCCHISPVTLSVTVPSPLSVYDWTLGAPAATSAGLLGMGHCAQFASRHDTGDER